jgi:hypothetical protein
VIGVRQLKKTNFLVKACLVLIILPIYFQFYNQQAIANSANQIQDRATLKDKTELSLKQAIELAFPSALKWNKNAQLHDAINIDLDKPGKLIGSNGKRKYWNVAFGVPDTNKFFLVTIHEGKIDQVKDLTHKGDSPYPKNEFIQMEDIRCDSPELLKRALKIGGIYPGKDWAKGYNFWIIKDKKTNTSLILVIGWNSKNKQMKAIGFNATTGEYVQPN